MDFQKSLLTDLTTLKTKFYGKQMLSSSENLSLHVFLIQCGSWKLRKQPAEAAHYRPNCPTDNQWSADNSLEINVLNETEAKRIEIKT